MTGLIFFVVGVGHEYRRESVKCNLVVGLGVVDHLRRRGLVQAGVVRLTVMQGDRESAGKKILIDPYHRCPEQGAELMHEPGEVTRAVQLFAQPDCLSTVRKVAERSSCLFQLQGRHHAFRCQHATLHCGVVAFDLDAVKRSRVTANQYTTGEGHFRQRVFVRPLPVHAHRRQRVRHPPALRGSWGGFSNAGTLQKDSDVGCCNSDRQSAPSKPRGFPVIQEGAAT